ncbi:MAG: KTSC domain-containing protein [Pseudomonadota bacterium]
MADDILRKLKAIPLHRVNSSAIEAMGFDEKQRMLVVVFQGGGTKYGYPHLSDEEIKGLLAVMVNHESLGHYVATVVKPNHDHERVQMAG